MQTKIKITEIQATIATDTTIIVQTKHTIRVAISKITDITTIAIHQTRIKTESTQTNNHADIVTEQIINPGIVKLVLNAEGWHICLANVEHHDKKTIDNKIRMLTKTRKITTKTATELPRSNKIL